ncbi:MAG: GNAT family N-acetyltransferase [Chloroflexota bacterium]
MSTQIQIRSYQPTDLPGINELEARVKPYRPEDQAQVEAMFARAKEAERLNDPCWMAPPPYHGPAAPETYAAFWVANQHESETGAAIVGTAAVQCFQAGEEMAATHPLAHKWDGRGGLLEMRRIRVSPEVRGQGIGRRLCQVAVEWAKENRFSLFVVNSTTPQTPALQLYRSLGFQDVGISFIGKYALQWLALDLGPTGTRDKLTQQTET